MAQQSAARQSTPPEPPLTSRQSVVLSAIRGLIASQGYPPTLRQIGDEVGLNSLDTVRFHLRNLEDMGYLSRVPGQPRALKVTDPHSSPDA